VWSVEEGESGGRRAERGEVERWWDGEMKEEKVRTENEDSRVTYHPLPITHYPFCLFAYNFAKTKSSLLQNRELF
jgi:hypothetical protein